MMTKQELRKKYKDLRAALTQDERDERSLEIANQALSMDIWNHDYYHIFLPIDRLREIDTQYLLSILGGKDKNVIISKSNFQENTLSHYLLTDNTKIVVNEYGIPEPEDGIEIPASKLDVVFIPLLAYDEQGNRIGYGKGFYDRFLAQCKPDVIKIGLSYFEPEEHLIDINTQDIGINRCISPKKIYSF
jgi:5-formyltetrahydrofolate cyclo-ligase